MKNIMPKFLLALFLCFAPMLSVADTAAELKAVMLKNLDFVKRENIEGMLSTLHTLSPSYVPTQEYMEKLFPVYDLDYELLHYQFIGVDEVYAYAKVRQLTTKVSGPEFEDNEFEFLQVFKQELGVWKIWAQANLSIQYK